MKLTQGQGKFASKVQPKQAKNTGASSGSLKLPKSQGQGAFSGAPSVPLAAQSAVKKTPTKVPIKKYDGMC